MFTIENTTLICPNNDLESKTIIEIATDLKMDVRVSGQSWGARLGLEPSETFLNLKPKVLVVEMPDPDREQLLRDQDCKREVVVIDHHSYQKNGKPLDRGNPLSSLEQFARKLNVDLERKQMMAAINDRGYIWGLLEAGASYDEIQQIRREDFVAQGWKETDYNRCQVEFEHIKGKIEEFHSSQQTLFIHEVDFEKIGYLLDLFHLPDRKTFQEYRERKADPVNQNILIIQRLENQIKVFFSGRKDIAEQVGHFLIPMSTSHFTGGEQPFGFTGFTIGGDHSVDQVRDACSMAQQLADVKPTLHDSKIDKFTSFFLFPFHYENDGMTPGDDWEECAFHIPKNPYDLCTKEYLPQNSSTRDTAFSVQKPAGDSSCTLQSYTLQKNYAEYIYFHDYVRSFLFRTSPPPSQDVQQKSLDHMRFFRFKKTKNNSLIVELETTGLKKLAAIINGIYLHLYPGNVAVLSLEISNKAEFDDPEKEKEWNDQFKDCFEKKYISFNGGDLLLFNNMFRRVYPAYFEQDDFDCQIDNKEFPRAVKVLGKDLKEVQSFGKPCGYDTKSSHLRRNAANERYYPPVNGFVKTLLSCFSDKNDNPQYFPILDDRMLVYTFVAFDSEIGRKVDKKSQHIFFSHLMYVDNPGNDYRYNSDFMEQLMKPLTYGRWLHWGTQMGFSRYSGAFMYFGFCNYLYRPFVSMYYQMFMLITFYRARLILFSVKVSKIAEQFTDDGKATVYPSSKLKKDLRDLHTRFMQFMNMHWFIEVTNQDQGIELFELMRKAFNLEPMYNQVKEEIERADEVVHLLHNQRVEAFNYKAGVFGLIVGFLAILTGYFGMNFPFIIGSQDHHWLTNDYMFFIITALIVGGFLTLEVLRRKTWDTTLIESNPKQNNGLIEVLTIWFFFSLVVFILIWIFWAHS